MEYSDHAAVDPMAFGFAAAVEIFFGIYPARRAATSIRSSRFGTNRGQSGEDSE